ncbi:MAG: DUF1214 domain-containing protein [Pseudomonadales bacterium]
MLKKLAFALVLLVAGIVIGQQLPRGAALFATLGSLGSSATTDYSTLKSHQALLDLEAMIGSTRQLVLEDARTEQEAVEGMRWVLRLVAQASELAGDGNPKLPHFQRMDTLKRKLGGDNPDAEYEHAWIDGQYDYIITGNVGSVAYLGFTINAGQGKSPRRNVDYISDKMLSKDEDGNFTLILAKEKPALAGDWIQIPADASGILVRQYIADRSTEVLPQLNIRVLGQQPEYVPPTDEGVAGLIEGASFTMLKLSTLHRYILPELMEDTNSFIRATSENFGDDIAGTDNLYMLGSYQLDNHEALIIKVVPPQTRYWNLALESRWHELPDYLHRPISRTMKEVEFEADGSVEFVVAHSDPGHPNWLDTSMHNFGFMTLRWLDAKSESVPMPEVRKVKFETLLKENGQ